MSVELTDGYDRGFLNDSVTLAIKSGTGTTGAVLGGIVTRAASDGVASFSGLTVSLAGTGYQLVATSGSLTGYSTTFNVVTGGTATVAAPVITAPVNGLITNRGTSALPLVISGTAPASASVQIRRGGYYYANPIATVTADAAGAWTASWPGAASDEDVSLVAYATDAAGTMSIESSAVTVHIDRTAPAIRSASLNRSNVTVQFSEPILQATSAGFSTSTSSSSPVTVTSAVRSAVDPRLFTVVLSRALVVAESISVTYTPGDLADVAGNAVLGPVTVSVATADTAGPVLTGATVERQTVWLYFSEPIAPATGVTGFSAMAGMTPVSITSAVRDTSSSTIVLTLALAIQSGVTVTVSYTGGNVTDEAVPTPNQLAAFSAQPVTNASSGPSLSLAQTSGPGGTVVDLVGSGYPAGQAVLFTWSGASYPTTPSAVIVQANGSFSLSFAVPSTPAGGYNVYATAGGLTRSATFAVTPTLTATPDGAAVGATITVSGTGAPGATILTLQWDGVAVGTATSSATGSFSTTFSRPAASAGNHIVSAAGGAYSRSLTYSVAPALALSVLTGPTGTQTIATGVGFASSSLVTVDWEGTTVGTATTDANGSFTVSFASPVATSGAHAVRATAGSAVAFATFSVTP
ncbi:MAG TPA: SwmB domain-containing protein [Candidatus Saccharimonadales bacterium]|nr:SwmB domain-containing protein [Candidatus Saccharimonadales bacterium]